MPANIDLDFTMKFIFKRLNELLGFNAIMGNQIDTSQLAYVLT